MSARGRHEHGQPVEPLEGGEIEHICPSGRAGVWEGKHEALARLHPGQALTGEEGAGAITEQSLHPRRAKQGHPWPWLSSPLRSAASMRISASREKPPPWSHWRISAAVSGVMSPRRATSRSTRCA